MHLHEIEFRLATGIEEQCMCKIINNYVNTNIKRNFDREIVARVMHKNHNSLLLCVFTKGRCHCYFYWFVKLLKDKLIESATVNVDIFLFDDLIQVFT